MSQKIEISNLMGWFCLKGILVQPKTVAGVSSYDTEGPWKIWGETDYWFQNQPRKNSANFVQASKKGRNIKIYRIVFSKRYIGSTKNCGRSFILWHWTAMENLGENWLLPSNSAQKKIWQFCTSEPQARNFKFDRIVFSKRCIGWAKTRCMSFMLWH